MDPMIAEADGILQSSAKHCESRSQPVLDIRFPETQKCTGRLHPVLDIRFPKNSEVHRQISSSWPYSRLQPQSQRRFRKPRRSIGLL